MPFSAALTSVKTDVHPTTAQYSRLRVGRGLIRKTSGSEPQTQTLPSVWKGSFDRLGSLSVTGASAPTEGADLWDDAAAARRHGTRHQSNQALRTRRYLLRISDVHHFAPEFCLASRRGQA